MNNKQIMAIAQTIRSLSIDAIEKANSGHPGLPLGAADIAATLFSSFLNINPGDSKWINRDRFILSAGHGSMLLYSLLHLSGFNLDINEIKNFRQANSLTPGHPEYNHTPGVEATTGPLGQGIANAVGIAIAQEKLSKTFNTNNRKIIDYYTYVLAGDGCLMEGISYEAASLAGHLGLGKLIILYDSNNITIEGNTDLAFTENVLDRFKALGWDTHSGNGHDLDNIKDLINKAKNEVNKPSIIEFKTKIGFSSPLQGTSTIHGTPLGKDDLIKTKKVLDIPVDTDFYVNPIATDAFKIKNIQWSDNYIKWQNEFFNWSKENPQLRDLWDNMFNAKPSFEEVRFDETLKIATRKAFGLVLNSAAKSIPSLFGGSADLSPSTNTDLKGRGSFSKENRLGGNINFGIREHAMGGILNGLALNQGIIPYGSTFLVFSDYLKPSIRLSSLMGLKVIYIFTHDSIYVGEDGPTHEPIEHIEALRGIPGLLVLRPADAQECNCALELALNNNGPCAIILSRQDLEVFKKPNNFREEYKKGAYIVNNVSEPKGIILATGSEVNKALEICKLTKEKLRVVSVTSRELLLKQDIEYINKIIPRDSTIFTLEAGITSGWEGFATTRDRALGINTFGISGKSSDIEKLLGFSTQDLANKILKSLNLG